MGEMRLLPTGLLTLSSDDYVRQWHALAEPIERRLGWKLLGFDPGLLFLVSEHSTSIMAVELALEFQRMDRVDAAKTRFAKALSERRYDDAAMVVFELLAAVVESRTKGESSGN